MDPLVDIINISWQKYKHKRRKALNIILYEKAAHKMLVKLTPKLFYERAKTLKILSLSQIKFILLAI